MFNEYELEQNKDYYKAIKVHKRRTLYTYFKNMYNEYMIVTWFTARKNLTLVQVSFKNKKLYLVRTREGSYMDMLGVVPQRRFVSSEVEVLGEVPFNDAMELAKKLYATIGEEEFRDIQKNVFSYLAHNSRVGRYIKYDNSDLGEYNGNGKVIVSTEGKLYTMFVTLDAKNNNHKGLKTDKSLVYFVKGIAEELKRTPYSYYLETLLSNAPKELRDNLYKEPNLDILAKIIKGNLILEASDDTTLISKDKIVLGLSELI